MPTGEPQSVQMFPAQINVPAEDPHLFISVSIQTDGQAAEGAVEAATQEIVDLFQAWPGRLQVADVTGQLYGVELSGVTPTNPVPPPDPPEEDPDPNDLVAGEDEAPSTVV